MNDLTITESQKEIMEKIPDSLSRIGILFLIFLLLVLFCLSYYIRYPDTLSGQATLNSVNPAVVLTMPSSGKINLLLRPKNFVQENEIIGVVDNPADYNDISCLKKQLLDFYDMDDCNYDSLYCSLSVNLKLGEIKTAYVNFVVALHGALKRYDKCLYNHGIKSLKDKLIIEQLNLNAKEAISTDLRNRIYYLEKSLLRDSLLFQKGLISVDAFEVSKSSFLQQKVLYQESVLDYKSAQGSLIMMRNEIVDIQLKENKSSEDISNALLNSYIELFAMIEAWEKKYLIVSPIQGILDYMQFLSTNQYIVANTNLFSIMPKEHVSEVEVVLPSQGVGKIQKGQKAIIKLIDYPSREYGDLIGTVDDVSLSKMIVDGQNLSLIKVRLDNNGSTSYGISIDLHSGMSASVDIVTEDRRLISRIFEKIKSSIH